MFDEGAHKLLPEQKMNMDDKELQELNEKDHEDEYFLHSQNTEES